MSEPLVGTLTLNRAREWRIETADPCATRSLYSMLWPLRDQPVRVSTHVGHKGRCWLVIETEVAP